MEVEEEGLLPLPTEEVSDRSAQDIARRSGWNAGRECPRKKVAISESSLTGAYTFAGSDR